MPDLTHDDQEIVRKAIQCAHDNGLRIGRESAAEGVRLGIETATKAFAPVLDTIVKTFEKIADSNADTVRKAMSAFVDGSGGELVRPAGCFPKRRSKKRKKVMKGSFDMAPYGYCPECFSAGCFPQPDGSILCFQGHRFDKDDAEYASTQIDLTGGIRERLAEFSAQIADGDLIEDGRETDFHITAKFGLHYSDATLVSAIVADFGPVHYYVSDFAAFQNDEYDVLYARVESDDLYRLNAKLSELCCTTTHPTYTPHATVAYLNPGLADKYIRRFGGISLRGTADTLTFSSPSREETKIPLGGTPLGSVAKGMKDDSGHEHGGDGKFTGSGSSGGDTQSSSEPAKEKPKHQPVELAVHSHATKLVRDAGRHKTPERVQELVDSTREKVKTAYAREWKHIQDSVRAKYGDDVADDPAMEEVKGILKDGLRSANASIDEMENGLMNGAKRGSLMPGSMFLDGASEEADAIQKHQTETMDRAFNRLALVISKHKGVVKKSVHLREDLLGEDESDPDPMDALTQAVVEEVYAAREQGDDDAVRAIIERYREMIDDPALLEEYAGGVVKKGWSESDHPRSKTGQFIAKDDLKEAQTNPEKAKELREKVRPEDADKLEAVISGDKDPGRTKRGEQRHQAGQRREKKAANLKRANEIADKIAGGEGTAEDHHELADHLEGLTLDQLGILRSKIATRSGGRKKADVVGRLRDALRTGQSHAAVQRTMPKDHARLAMSGFQPNRHDVADSNGEKVKAGTGYVRYEDGRPVGYSADDAERISSSVTPEDALARIDMHDAASKDEAVDPMLRDYHAELADQLRGHHEATFGAKSPSVETSDLPNEISGTTVARWNDGSRESAESIMDRVKSSPNQPKDRDWGRYADRFGIDGEFVHTTISSDALKKEIAAGNLRKTSSINPESVDQKKLGERNPVIISKEPGRGSVIVDGNHSLQAALDSGDESIPVIVSTKSPLASASRSRELPTQPSITPRLGPPGGGENSNEGTAFAEKQKKEASPFKSESFDHEPGFYGSVHEAKIGDATVQYQMASNGNIELSSVRVPTKNRGKGEARRAVQELLAEADRRGLGVQLIASPLDSKTKLGKLVDFYKSLGFEVSGRGNPAGDPKMVRPKSEKAKVPSDDQLPGGQADNAPPPSPPQSFKVFRGTGRGYANDHGVAGKGEYWSGAKQVAESYAGKNGKVSESTIHLERPLVLSYPELNSLQEKLYGRSLTGFEPDLSEKFDKWLRDAGYDGVALFDKEISEDIPQEVIKLAQSTPVGSTTRQRDGVATPKQPDQLPGGQADNAPDAAFPTDKLAEGQKHEGEHTTDPALAKEIAKDHLAEDPAYYDKLAKVEGGSADSQRGTPNTAGAGGAKEPHEMTAVEALRAGVDYHDWHNAVTDAFRNELTAENDPIYHSLQGITPENRDTYKHAQRLMGQQVVDNHGKTHTLTGVAPDLSHVVATDSKGRENRHSMSSLLSVPEYVSHYVDDAKRGGLHPSSAEKIAPFIAKEIIAENGNLFRKLREYGVDPSSISGRMLRDAIAAAIEKQKNTDKPQPSEALQLARERAKQLEGVLPAPQQSPAVASEAGPSVADQIAAIDKRLAEVNGDDPDATADQQRQMMRLMNEKSKLADQQKRSESAKPSAAATSDPLTPHIDRLAPLIEMGQNRVITTELAQKATAELEKMPQSQVAELANRLLPDGFAGKRKSDAIYAIRKKMLTANQGYAGADDWDNWSKDQVTEMPTVSEEDKSRYREKHAAKSPAAEMSATPAPSTAPKKPKAAPKPKAAVNESVVNEHADRLAPLVERAKGERFSQEFVDETVKSVEHLPKEELRAIASKITGVGQQFIKTKQQALNDIRGKLTPLQRYDDSQLA